MSQLNIRITLDQHRQLKTLASYSGMSIKQFVLSRVFVEAAETVFSPKVQKSVPRHDLSRAQEILFKKAHIITASPEKWESLKNKTKMI